MNVGIICEFNPFHKGHKYLIDKVKKADNDRVICCMSGNFVQRGEFAVFNKYERAKIALENGADLIIELPAAQSTLSAEGFAKSAVDLLESIGVVDSIAFGAECADLDKLKKAADIIKSTKTQKMISAEMKSGISYPAARSKILKSDILETPNNILATEYIKFTSLPCTVIKRIGKGHDTDDELYSSSAIRKTLDENKISSVYNCEKAVLYKLRTISKDSLLMFDGISEGLENRIKNAANVSSNLDELYMNIKTKRYTLSRIKRIILRVYLGITGYSAEAPYIHILGFNEKGKSLLSEIKKKSSKPIITKLSDCDKITKPFFINECLYTDIYNLGYKTPLPCGTEQKSQIVVI
ncbi:MAG: nucleotidyltransferase family protein [Clostridiales bacterium]|nr:nucleotidyltransferase family protein [Clostridiales bacterium]